VSACDKLHNAQAILKDYQAIGDDLWQRFKGGKDGTLWYYRALVEAFKEGGELPMLGALEQVVSELEAVPSSANIRVADASWALGHAP
jgi:hypothetical protein